MLEVNKIYQGDCLKTLKNLNDNSVDAIITDPPYGYSFMGKDWDKAVPNINVWKECLRILKPGSFCMVMSSPRQDVLSRMIINLEDAGFKTDFTSIYWTYASGFPKASNIGKMVDKRGGKYLGWFIDYILKVADEKGISKKELTMLFPSKNGNPTGWLWNKQKTQSITIDQYNKIKEFLNLPFENINEAEREVIGKGDDYGHQKNKTGYGFKDGFNTTKSFTPQAKALDGSYGGFQPKPAVEVIIVCMKPLSEKTYVDQALNNGKGITWLDDCRIPLDGIENHTTEGKSGLGKYVYGNYDNKQKELTELPRYNTQGRFPANLLVSDDVLNNGSITKSTKAKIDKTASGGIWNKSTGKPAGDTYSDSGSFSRYFDLDKWYSKLPFLIVPKESKSEKNKGLNRLPKKQGGMRSETSGQHITRRDGGDPKPVVNHHPTVKPIKLMSYLITLASREGDIILDPFCGSGTTCVATIPLNRKYIGIDLSEEYCDITRARIINELNQTKMPYT